MPPTFVTIIGANQSMSPRRKMTTSCRQLGREVGTLTARLALQSRCGEILMTGYACETIPGKAVIAGQTECDMLKPVAATGNGLASRSRCG